MSDFLWYPSVEVESSSGVREIGLYTHNLMKRNIYILGEINSISANNIMTQLLYLKSVSNDPINIFINSGGGEVQAGLMIYDLITTLKIEINMYCTGIAASMAAIIFSSAKKGHRFILPHSKTMIHEPLIAGGVGGSASSIHDISESILETRKICNELLARHTGKTLEEINSITMHDHYMNAQESVAFGLCDHICFELP